MQVTNKFNPQPGDKIICNNGEEFICCTLEKLKSKGVGYYPREEVGVVFGISENWENDCSWMYWQGDNYPDEYEWQIREVIPKQKEEVMSDKEEPKYTIEDIRNTFSALRWETTSSQKFIETLNKVVNPEYSEYLRLKAIYE